MKKKQVRTIVIAALVFVLAVTAILRIDIEPAEQASPSPTLSSPMVNPETPAATPDSSGNEQLDKMPDTEATISPLPDSENTGPQQTPDADTQEQSPSSETAVPETPDTAQPVETLPPADTPVPEPAPTEPERHVCTIEIRCDTVVDTSKLENQAVAPYVPTSGVILATTELEFTPGESVFDILLRATKDQNIHMEFRDDSLYSGKYIEGINYLYEMDGGPLSGWMYKVNGQFPNYGCAAYEVNDGDAIVWMYTCDLGLDVGDNSTW